MRFTKTIGIAALALAGLVGNASAANFSFSGNFTQDDDVQLFNFSVASPSTITLRTWSYAGGTNAAGQLISRGGFDPILALFTSAGALISQNDDGDANVAADSVTNEHYDTYLQVANLAAGNYTVSVMEWDNFAIGPNLANGFRHDGDGNFRTNANCRVFLDASGDCRDSHWAFDILNVADATQDGGNVPEPASLALLGLGFAGLGFSRRRKSV